MDAALTEAVESKSYDMLGDLEKRVSQLAADRAELGAGRGHCWWGPCFRVARWRSLCLAIRPTDFSFLLYD